MARQLWADLRPHLVSAQRSGQTISLGGHRCMPSSFHPQVTDLVLCGLDSAASGVNGDQGAASLCQPPCGAAAWAARWRCCWRRWRGWSPARRAAAACAATTLARRRCSRTRLAAAARLSCRRAPARRLVHPVGLRRGLILRRFLGLWWRGRMMLCLRCCWCIVLPTRVPERPCLLYQALLR